MPFRSTLAFSRPLSSRTTRSGLWCLIHCISRPSHSFHPSSCFRYRRSLALCSSSSFQAVTEKRIMMARQVPDMSWLEMQSLPPATYLDGGGRSMMSESPMPSSVCTASEGSAESEPQKGMNEDLVLNSPPTLVLISFTWLQTPQSDLVHPIMHFGFDEVYTSLRSVVIVPHPVAESSSESKGDFISPVMKPSRMQTKPSRVCTIHVAQRRPRIPYRALDQSERMPPSDRMQIFMRPKQEAKMPEKAGDRPWYSVK